MTTDPMTLLKNPIPTTAAPTRFRATPWSKILCKFTGGVVVPCFLASLVVLSAQAPFEEVFDYGDLTEADNGASWGDFDNDGDIDLYLASWGLDGPNPVYSNDGNGVFTRMTADNIGELGADTSDASMGVWGDLDNDGDLDLYVANFAHGPSDEVSPPAADVVYLNDGNNRFSKYEEAEFTLSPRYSNVASLVDYDRDGLLDVFVSTWPYEGSQVDVLYQHDGALRFHSIPSVSELTAGMGGSWVDVDGDGDLDVLAASIDDDNPSVLYLNESSDAGVSESFRPVTSFPHGGVVLPRVNSGVPWGDVDNDGDLDALMTHWASGFDLVKNNASGSFSKSTIGLNNGQGSGTAAWLDADNDGDLDILVGTISGGETAGSRTFVLMENLGADAFDEQLVVDGIVPYGWRGMAVGDYDNDGFMDFLLIVFAPDGVSQRDRLYKNVPNSNHWLKLSLTGTESNASAIGAIVRIKATIGGEETWQMRQVSAGGETAWIQHDMRPNFGLGDAELADIVRIEWPSGTVQELTNIAVDQILEVVEPPQLRVESGGQLSWPVTADGFQLESASSIDGTWSEATETVETNGSRKSITIQPAGGSKFYRLNGQ